MAFKSSKGRSLGMLLENFKTSTLGLGFGSGGAGGGGENAGSFSFDYHMYGATIGTLEVYVYDTSTSSLNGPLAMTYDNAVGTAISGQQQLSSTAAYKSATIDMTSLAGVTGYLAFKYRPGASSYTGDAAIDTMSLTLNDGTVVDLDPDLKRTASIDNWQTAIIQNQTDDTFPASISFSDTVLFGNSGPSMGNYIYGATSSSSTGPSYDSSGSTTSYYIYWETSGSNATYTSWVRTKNQYTF